MKSHNKEYENKESTTNINKWYTSKKSAIICAHNTPGKREAKTTANIDILFMVPIAPCVLEHQKKGTTNTHDELIIIKKRDENNTCD